MTCFRRRSCLKYRVRYEAGAKPGELVYPVNFTVWIPKGVATLRGVTVHQHGCGEGSCESMRYTNPKRQLGSFQASKARLNS